ncbi:ferrochelatase [uncultured Corynebacterium sp.]|uniref:ferrochelatase n=1 Tax=uncultured Corynebacterium sp. TaxID=159447 RepID=UPI0025DDCF3E|nr:ferrochelatase [uncultured Corynebacterium sp.]
MTDAHIHASDFGYDALLVLSFGGPEGNEEVVPFLENVTRGRGIPRERLKVVGKHYFHFDGVSPLNGLNRELIGHVEAELAARGMNLPVYFGNRNWHPFGTEAIDQLAADGRRNVLVFATSAWGGYSACRQYDEDIVTLRKYVEEQGYPEMTFTKLRQFYDHPKFIGEMAAAVRESFAAFGDAASEARLVFTAHSIPSAHDAAGGAEGDKHLYSRQVADAARLVAEDAGVAEYDLAWNSRSGNPATPWLEPDVSDRVEERAAEGVRRFVVCPIGFISDHMEVVWDLDTELAQRCADLGVEMQRVRTAGPSDSFASLVVDLIEEVQSGAVVPGVPVASGEGVACRGGVTVQGCTVNGAPCAEGCCDIRAMMAHR